MIHSHERWLKNMLLITRTICECNDPPWMDFEFKSCQSKRGKLKKTWKDSKTEENWKAYVEQRQLCAEMSIDKQEEYYSKVVDETGNDQKSLFKVVNDLLDRNKVRSLPRHTDPIQLANDFNDYYINKIEDIRKTIPSNSRGCQHPVHLFDGEDLNYFEPTTEEEVKMIIKELKHQLMIQYLLVSLN